MREVKRKELRERLHGVLPSELDTDFQLDRWLDNYEHDIEKCAHKFHEYILNRKAYGYDDPDFIKTFLDRNDVKRHLSIFCQSCPDGEWINQKDNGVIYVECGVADPIKVSKAVRTGDFLRIFFGLCEWYQKLVIEQEKITKKRAYVVCIFDMKDMSILQYANPLAPLNKIFEARVNIWIDYFGELLNQVVIVNPPRLLNALLKIMSLMLPARMLSRFHIATSLPDDIEKRISRDAIPTGYGGDKKFSGPPTLPTGYYSAKEMTKEDYLIDGHIWQKHKIIISHENHVINAGESFVTRLEAKKGQTLLYEYWTNRNFEICAIKESTENGKEYLLPRLRLSTPLLAEEGEAKISEDCEIAVEIKNLSKIMRMTLKIALKLIN